MGRCAVRLSLMQEALGAVFANSFEAGCRPATFI